MFKELLGEDIEFTVKDWLIIAVALAVAIPCLWFFATVAAVLDAPEPAGSPVVVEVTSNA